MLLIVVEQKKKFITPKIKFRNLKLDGFQELVVNNVLEEPVEQDLVIVIDCLVRLFFRKWISLVNLKF